MHKCPKVPKLSHYWKCPDIFLKKSRIQEKPNLSPDADSSTDIFVSAGVQKGDGSIIFFCPKKEEKNPPPQGVTNNSVLEYYSNSWTE